MARSTKSIKDLMKTEQATHPELTALNNPSQTSDFNEWMDAFSAQENINEQLWDALELTLNAKIALGAAATKMWIVDKVKNLFQYSATTPQILQVINGTLTYPTLDPTLRIVTRCAVTPDLNKNVLIKVNKSEPPVPLAALEYNSLYGFLMNILPADMSFNLYNLVSDKLYISADIIYDGQYTASIQSNTEATINAYLKGIVFDGTVIISDLEVAIKNVPGVKDVKFYTIKARADATPFAGATKIYDLATGANALKWQTVSGIIVPETTALNTLADTLNYVVG